MVPAEALPRTSPARVSRIVLMVNVALMTTQIGAGWLTGSNAIVADGVHTTVDLLIDAILFASLRVNMRGAAWLPSAIVAMLLTLTGAELLWQAAQTSDAPVADTSMQLCALLIAMTAIVARACVAHHLASMSDELQASHSHAADVLAAGAWHARIDAISAGAAALGALGTLAGFAHVDRLATFVIGGMMVCMGLVHKGGFLRLVR